MLAARSGRLARASKQHYRAAPIQVVLAVHLSIPACWLLVLAATPIHPCSIIGLQHSSGRAGCSYWQRHSYIDATLLGCSTLQAVLAARSGSSTHTLQAALLGCMQHSSSRAGCSMLIQALLAARTNICARTLVQHEWAAALFTPCWRLVFNTTHTLMQTAKLACYISHFVLAEQRSSPGTLILFQLAGCSY